ncbi:uncharacterized protein PFB0765w-like [Zerene cesonia]|uniref:uncharacterized protein PFB0765w-like n=1 Tax=Zerene cesonia TaxID=33412 RepID=UPI0018E595B5|nr:uncharacterized protein PFB0765w-like [Zerene cesonia]
MESSDESFAWTNASNDNSDSNDDNVNTLKVIDKMKYNKINQCEGKFNSTYLSEEDIVEKNQSKKAKKRKKSIENNSESPKKKHIKIEQQSDVDEKITKTKIKHEFDNNRAGDSDTSFNDTYLNLCVKEEQASDNIKTKKAKKSKKKKLSVNSNTEHDEVDKKYEIEEDSRQSFIIEDKITVEETVVSKPINNNSEYLNEESCIKPKKKKKKHKQSICENNDISEIQTSVNNYTDSNEELDHNNHNSGQADHSIVENGSADDSIENSQKLKNSKKNRKISDRIKFEDDTTDVEYNNHNDSTIIEENRIVPSKQMKRYIIENPNLQKLNIKISNKNFVVTETDEVWLFKCPRDIDITHLSGIKLDVSSKSKVKIDGKNYDTIVDDNISRLPILSYTSENRVIIRNVKLNGSLSLKKRLPKTNPLGKEMMADDHISYIPLPETKCRHPLFGVHYKKSIKIPAEITKRLKENSETHDDIDEVRKKKKKYKKEKRLVQEEVDIEPPEALKVEADTFIVHKKKKANKRKFSEVDESSPPKKKRLKHNPEASAETWESEQAIEETLFNF